jgi:hypothetical protein
VGDDDVAAGSVGVNTRTSERPERGVALSEFIDRLRTDVAAVEAPAADPPALAAGPAADGAAAAAAPAAG